MGVKALIGLAYQFAVEALLAAAGFVSRDEQNRSALGVEGKGQPPFTAGCAEPQLFHVRVAGAVECVNAGPA